MSLCLGFAVVCVCVIVVCFLWSGRCRKGSWGHRTGCVSVVIVFCIYIYISCVIASCIYIYICVCCLVCASGVVIIWCLSRRAMFHFHVWVSLPV